MLTKFFENPTFRCNGNWPGQCSRPANWAFIIPNLDYDNDMNRTCKYAGPWCKDQSDKVKN